MVLWDLAGKVLEQPVYQLLGGTNSGKVPVYDGSIYFSDLMPQYAARSGKIASRKRSTWGCEPGIGLSRSRSAVGSKWMDREAGDARDVEVSRPFENMQATKFTWAWMPTTATTWRVPSGFSTGQSDLGVEFIEEPFPEQVATCLELKQYIAERGWKTLLADGEGQDDVEDYRPFVDAKALDILQGDMYVLGIEGILAEAAMAHPQGISDRSAQLELTLVLVHASTRRPGRPQLLPCRARPAYQRCLDLQWLQNQRRDLLRTRLTGFWVNCG